MTMMIESPTRARIVSAARAWKGTPYHHQQSVRHFGTDCLGLVRGVWRDLYGAEPQLVPPYSRDWAEALGEDTLLEAARRWFVEIDKTTAREGDIVLFRYRKGCPAKHVGILVEPARMIHAHEGLPVTEFKMTGWWTRRIAGAFAFPGVTT